MINEPTTDSGLRLGIFIGVLLLMILWEWCVPNRQSKVPKSQRWSSNFALLIIGSVLSRLLFPAGLAAVAIWTQQHNVGLWQQLDVSLWWSVPISVVFFDCLIYWQHRMFHRLPWLWRLHRVHHADPHLDASSGLRFHPLEIVLSLLIKLIAVVALGAPVLAILIFEILLNATSLFNHTNVKLADSIERPLRKLIVTQAMHRIHHSQVVSETDSNFSFNLSLWDRLFGTYTDNAKHGDDAIKLGLKEYSIPQTNSNLKALLLMPFKQKPN